MTKKKIEIKHYCPPPIFGEITVINTPDDETEIYHFIEKELEVHGVDKAITLSQFLSNNVGNKMLSELLEGLNKRYAHRLQTEKKYVIEQLEHEAGYYKIFEYLKKGIDPNLFGIVRETAMELYKGSKDHIGKYKNDLVNLAITKTVYGVALYKTIGKIESSNIEDMKKGKKPSNTFNHSLTDENFENLARLINDIELFTNATNKDQVTAIFNLSINEPIQVEHNPRLAWLFNCLRNKSLITDEWQSVIEQNNLFQGKRGGVIKAKGLSKYLTEVSQTDDAIKQISNIINQLA